MDSEIFFYIWFILR